jgi:hypothetical protein
VAAERAEGERLIEIATQTVGDSLRFMNHALLSRYLEGLRLAGLG